MTTQVSWHASPNFGERRNRLVPNLIVLHFTAMKGCDAALSRLCDPEAEVSSHYLISEKGDVIQMVEEPKRAWHAGQGLWQGRDDVNSRSIGIELDNTGETPFSEPLMQALEELLPGVMNRWSIPAHGIIGHSDMAPTRKFDPGPRFDWRRLARSGLSIWPEPHPGKEEFMSGAARFGYDTEHGEAAILHAFRQRFRPALASVSASPDAKDCEMMANLADRFGIDRDNTEA